MKRSRTIFATPTRRTVMASGAAFAAAALPSMLQAATAPTGQRMRERLTTWLDMLNEGQRDRATFAFDSRTRRRWNYMLGSAFANGLALEDMTPAQKDAARDVLATALSPYGLETAENIMLQQDILRDELGKGRRDRNRERFSMQVYGTPSATEPWAWRWEGHHLTITVTLVGDEVVSTTPKAFSSEPNTVPSGPHRGLVVLENEALGRALFADLSGGAAGAARLRDRSYGNILAKPGREDAVEELRGLAIGDMTPSQGDIARRLLGIYTRDHLDGPLFEMQRARLGAEDEAAIRFGWAGDPGQGSIYYRLHGETVLIEFATLNGQPQHHHTVVHDPAWNFGDHRLG
ncbi:MAG: DUF3500 domain-containing protein [Pseudomonadota bacterium]